MPRAIWTGAISFGLVTVPVKLYAAVSSKTVKFNQLDSEDHSRIAMKRTNASTGDEVPYDRIVKGFEIAPDQYVVLEPDELATLEPKKTKTIDIEGFVDLNEVDPLYFDHPYYLVPGTGGAKPYRLLVQAMEETNHAAIAKVIIRSKQQLVALRARGDVLAMSTLNFHDELIDPDGLDEVPKDVEASDREVDMAKQLIASLMEPWEPQKYEDTYREEVLALIEKKAAGETITLERPEEEATPVPDLMSALKASLDAVREKGGDANQATNARKKTAAATNEEEDEQPAKKPGTSRKPAAKKAPAKKPAAAAKKPAATKR